MAMSGSYHAIPPVERVAAGEDTALVKAHSGDKSKGKLWLGADHAPQATYTKPQLLPDPFRATTTQFLAA